MDQRSKDGIVALVWGIFGVLMIGLLAIVCAGRADRRPDTDRSPVTVFRSWDASTGTGTRWVRLTSSEQAGMEADRLSRRGGLNGAYGRPVPRSALVAYGVEARDWSACRVSWGDTSWVVCPDGLVIGS